MKPFFPCGYKFKLQKAKISKIEKEKTVKTQD